MAIVVDIFQSFKFILPSYTTKFSKKLEKIQIFDLSIKNQKKYFLVKIYFSHMDI